MNPGLDERDLARRIRGGLKGENALAACGAVFLVVLAAGLITRLVTLFL
jgi:hypothetical protein